MDRSRRTGRKNDITFGVCCDIIQPGQIQIGDLVIPLSGKP